jgi:hypothetical protein
MLHRQSKGNAILPLLGVALLVLVVSMYVGLPCPSVICGHSASSDLLDESPRLVPDIGPDERGIPRPSDRAEYGPVFGARPQGVWAFQWAGATPTSVVKKAYRACFSFTSWRPGTGGINLLRASPVLVGVGHSRLEDPTTYDA